MRRPDTDKAELTLIGAGLVGSLLATFLARRGFDVSLYERRPDMRREVISAGRSINLAISVRGLHALRQIDLEEEVLRLAVPMRGRMMHAVDGALTFLRYGKDDSECINSISRGELNKLLLSAAERAGAEIHFNQKAVSADLERGSVIFTNERTGERREVAAPCVIGTDGSASVIRGEILARTGAACTQDYQDYGYKELYIPPPAGGGALLEKNALHIWPRGTFMLIALPNQDGSFTLTLFLPMKGPLSFEELHHPERVRELFREYFPDAMPLIPGLEEAFFANPTGHMVTVKCEAWHHRDRALLLGDAAHAIVPFFGQGMNCGFEDCSVLDEMLELMGIEARSRTPGNLERAFEEFFRSRKPNADAIADLAVENFVEMRDKVASPSFLLEKSVERILQEKFPGEYVSRYSLVTFSREPYRLAYEMGLVQSEILSNLCQNIRSPEQVDLELAGRLIRSRLSPLFANRKGSSGSHGS
jgi:kynurenine 3-monooxygenase